MKTNRTTRPAINPTLAKIAREILDLETLETRNSDGLDFSDKAVWAIRDALQAAFEAGRASVAGKAHESVAAASLRIRSERARR